MLSLQEFIDKTQGKPIGVDWNNPELDGECVSLVQQYIKQSFGVKMIPRGHGKDFATNLVNNGLAVRVSNPIYGDIVSWGENVASGYGHVAIYLNKGTVYDQNRTVNGKNNRNARVNNTLNVAPLGYVRMKAKLKPDPIKKDDTVDYWRKEGGTFTLNTAVNERTQPNVNGKYVKTHPKGTVLKYTQWGNSDKYTWFYLTNGNYVAYGERGVEVYGVDKPDTAEPVAPKERYITVQGDVRLFKVARKDDTYPHGKNVKTNVAKRTLKVLDEDNGRVKVRIAGFDPEVLWLANSEVK